MGNSRDNKEIIALIGLIDEPDESVFQLIREQLLAIGPEVVPLLENTWENTFNPLIQDRIEDIIHQIQFNQLLFEFENWRLLNPDDLLKGFLLISRYQYPEINEEALVTQVEQLKWEIWLELNDNLTALEKIKVVNHVLYGIHKFGANMNNANALQNFFINNLLETQRGNPISLGILYLVLCQRLNIPVYGVDLPDHFVLGYTKELRQDDVVLASDKKQVLFYINPVKRGIAFTRNEVELYLAQMQIEDDPSYFFACDNLAVIKRLIQNLMDSYRSFNLDEKVKELQNLLEILSD
ncbi:MAG: transglutaminase-like domain-containing protein [Bacteroidales bacterium]